MTIFSYSPGQRHHCCWYVSITDTKPRSAAFAFGEIAEGLTDPMPIPRKEDAPLFRFSELKDVHGEGRKGSGIHRLHAVVGDIDKFDQAKFDAGMATLKEAGARCVAYPTFTATVEAPRWRVVVLLDEPVSPDEYGACWRGLNAVFGGILDAGAKDAARLSYAFSYPKGGKPIANPIVLGAGS